MKMTNYSALKELFNINFYVDDARVSILNIEKEYDLMFLDAFTYSKAPELWSVEFVAELYKRLSPCGLLMTYSTSALVRKTLLDNSFYVGKICDKKTGKAIGTIASKDKSLIDNPLSNYEMGLCSTKAGIPYHDPLLNLPREEILARRMIDFENSDLMSSSQYSKMRSKKEDDSVNDDE